jgi:hypothetical protein
LVVLGLALCTLAGSAAAQDDAPAEVATDEAQGTKTEAQDGESTDVESAGQGDVVNEANNPLADLIAVQLHDYNIPFGLGVGKVLKHGKAVFNLFLEPQFTIAHKGVGQPATQIFAAVNIQFMTGKH